MNTTITREQFAFTFEKVFGKNYDKLFDNIFEGFTTTHFKCFYYEELITWYKIGHIGRALKITKDDANIDYIEEMFKEFKNELNL